MYAETFTNPNSCLYISHASEITWNYAVQTVSRKIREILTQRAANFNIALDDVSITSLTFGREFTAAIEAKQVAAQEAERAKFIVEKAEQDKRSAIIRAQVSPNSNPQVLNGLQFFTIFWNEL